MKAIIQTTLNQAQLTDIQELRFSSISIKINNLAAFNSNINPIKNSYFDFFAPILK